MRKRNKQSGFTLVELLVAISIFAVFITVSSSSLVDVIKTEQKGNVLRKTQSDTRFILETIARDSRQANGELDIGGARITQSYKKNGDNLEVYSTINDKVKKTVYTFVPVGGTDKNTIQKTESEKNVGENDSSYVLGTPVNLNDYNQVIIKNFTFEVISSDLNNLLIPPQLKIIINAESGKGRNFVKDAYRAYTTLETIVTPRSY